MWVYTREKEGLPHILRQYLLTSLLCIPDSHSLGIDIEMVSEGHLPVAYAALACLGSAAASAWLAFAFAAADDDIDAAVGGALLLKEQQSQLVLLYHQHHHKHHLVDWTSEHKEKAVGMARRRAKETRAGQCI